MSDSIASPSAASLRGSIVALVTPMAEDGAVDFVALKRLVDWHVQQGTHGIVAVGTTGESPTLAVDEHLEVISTVVQQADGRIPVIGGTGANSTAEAIELTRAAAGAGVDACLLVTPYYNRPSQEGLYRHYRAVAEAVAIPQILYNVPGRTACDLKPETVLRLAELPNLFGIKEASGQMSRYLELLASLKGRDFLVLSGDDGLACEAMLAGAAGVISVTANVAPAAMAAMAHAALAGNARLAQELDARLQPLHEALFLEANPIPVKWAACELGLIPAGIRLPLTPLAEGFRPAVRGALRHAGLF